MFKITHTDTNSHKHRRTQMISRYSGIKWNLKTVAKGQTQFINLCAPELDRRLYEAEAVMAAAFLFLYSLLLYCREDSVLGYMSKPLRALKWLPNANQNESCCGKSVREIKRVKAGTDKGMKEAARKVLNNQTFSYMVVH